MLNMPHFGLKMFFVFFSKLRREAFCMSPLKPKGYYCDHFSMNEQLYLSLLIPSSSIVKFLSINTEATIPNTGLYLLVPYKKKDQKEFSLQQTDKKK